MFWVIYLCSITILSSLVSKVSKKNYFKIFTILIVILLTPAQIEVPGSNYAPAVLTFFFDILFQQEFSLRVLRPLFLTLPFCLVSLFLFSRIKRRFF